MSSRRAVRPSSRHRVGIDAGGIAAAGKGVARYLLEILPELRDLDPPLELVVFVPRDVTPPAGLRVRAVRSRPASVWEQMRLPWEARRERLSLLHTLSDRLPLTPVPPVVLYLFEDPRRRRELARGRRGARRAAADALTSALFPHSLRTATAILTSSRATADDVLARGVPDDRVRVVYPGISEVFRPARDAEELHAVRRRLGYPGGYVLHFSSDDPRDNTRIALEAYAELRRRVDSAPPLLVPGPVRGELATQQSLARRLGLDGRVHWLGYQSGQELALLYRGASAYLDPSIFEGFGFQVAEALASGAPAVCSATTSLPEVVGTAGILLPPDDVRGFGEALEFLLVDETRAAELRERAVRQAARFSWGRTAKETVAVWKELLR